MVDISYPVGMRGSRMKSNSFLSRGKMPGPPTHCKGTRESNIEMKCRIRVELSFTIFLYLYLGSECLWIEWHMDEIKILSFLFLHLALNVVLINKHRLFRCVVLYTKRCVAVEIGHLNPLQLLPIPPFLTLHHNLCEVGRMPLGLFVVTDE